MALNNAASGEDTLTNAKLSSLRAVGSGFGYLIYELKADADFYALAKGCRFVWEAMQHTPYLPQYLVRDGSFCPNSRIIRAINNRLLCMAIFYFIGNCLSTLITHIFYAALFSNL